MNLIVDERKLDRQQERAIYELTLKKQRSKKSTVSQRHLVAMQQLADELVALRKSSQSQHHHCNHLDLLNAQCRMVSSSSLLSSSNSSGSISDEASSIKLAHLRLEELNTELERRLHQYEYLVAQEKNILGSYNINLFASESVNNFHLFARADPKNSW